MANRKRKTRLSTRKVAPKLAPQTNWVDDLSIFPTVAEPTAAALAVAAPRAPKSSEVLRLQRVATELHEEVERLATTGRDVAHLREAARVFLTSDSLPYRMPHDPKFRPFSPLSTDTLRMVARTNDVSASCISHLISEVVKVPLKIAPKDAKDVSRATQRAVDAATAWMDEDGGLGGYGVRRAIFEAQMVRDVLEIGAMALHFEFETVGDRLDGKPSQVRALDAATIQPLVTPYGFPAGDTEFAYTQWVMGVQVGNFARDEMIYEGLPSFARSDSPYFMSPTEYAVVQIYTLMRVDEWNRTWLTDGSGYQQWLKLNDSVTPAQAKEWIEIMNLQTAGNARERQKIGVAPGDITGDHSRKDQDFDGYEHSRMDRICSCYRVNPASIGQHSRQYKDSQEAAMDSTREGMVAELLLQREQLYNRILRRMGWGFLEVTEDLPAPTESSQDRSTRQAGEIAGGVRTVNEVRTENGAESLEGGDELLLPSNLKPLSQLIAPPPEPQLPGGDNAPDGNEAPDGAPNDEAESAERAETSVELARGYDYSCVMAMLPKSAADRVRKFARDLISADSLSGDGFEDEPYITLRYGLHTANASDVADVLHPWVRIAACVTGVSVFKTEQYDVVTLDVGSHDDDLTGVHDLLGELEHTDTYSEFKPHITLAYVKPGMGAKYAGARFPFWRGESDVADAKSWLSFDDVRFSSKDGAKTDINLRDGHVKAVARALGQWERKSLKRLERGQSASCAFESEILSDEWCTAIAARLAGVFDKSGVREVFARTRDGNGAWHGDHDGRFESHDDGGANIGGSSNSTPAQAFESSHDWSGDALPESESEAFQRGKADAVTKLLPYAQTGTNEAASVILKKDGSESHFAVGKSDQVWSQIPRGEAVAQLHTHPYEWAHSDTDWIGFLQIGEMEQVHIVTPLRTYSLVKPSGWTSPLSTESESAIEANYDADYESAKNLRPGWSRANETYWRAEASRRMAQRYGIIFREGKR